MRRFVNEFGSYLIQKGHYSPDLVKRINTIRGAAARGIITDIEAMKEMIKVFEMEDENGKVYE